MPVSIAKPGARAGSPYDPTVAKKKPPTTHIVKPVSYVASSSDSTQVLSLSQTDSSSAVKTGVPVAIEVENTGHIPVIAKFIYEEYSDSDTDAGEAAVQTVLLPGQKVSPPIKAAIVEAGNNPLRSLSGTFVDYTSTVGDGSAVLSAFKSDSGDAVASGELNNTTDPVVFEIDNGHEKYRVNDMIRVENEILRVEGTYDDNPTTSTVADNHIVVSRGHLGSTAASHSGTPDIYFHCFNEYHPYNRVLLGSDQVNMTDERGRYKGSSWFGYGRTDSTADNKTFGVIPGSLGMRFYRKTYVDVFMGGTGATGGTAGANIPITNSSSSFLSTSTAYAFNLTIDDSSATTVSFTTDSSNIKFGGAQGIIEKLNSAINTATKTAGNALFGYSCSVSIVNGALRFQSNSHMAKHDGTNGSKILLADAGSGTNLFAGTSGVFPDILRLGNTVLPELPPVSIYDPITHAKSPNLSELLYDDGLGNLIYQGNIVGKVNYITGAFDISGGVPALAQFEIQVAHGSVFAGPQDNSQEDSNTIKAVHANVFNGNVTGEMDIKVY